MFGKGLRARHIEANQPSHCLEQTLPFIALPDSLLAASDVQSQRHHEGGPNALTIDGSQARIVQ
jgi:hypothetical protein